MKKTTKFIAACAIALTVANPLANFYSKAQEPDSIKTAKNTALRQNFPPPEERASILHPDFSDARATLDSIYRRLAAAKSLHGNNPKAAGKISKISNSAKALGDGMGLLQRQFESLDSMEIMLQFEESKNRLVGAEPGIGGRIRGEKKENLEKCESIYKDLHFLYFQAYRLSISPAEGTLLPEGK